MAKDDFKTPSDFCAGPTITLPDGSKLTLSELVYQSLRSAFIVQPWTSDSEWELFSYGRSQDVAGAPGLKASRAHTNIPRSGDSGLPKAWEAAIFRWRASLNVPLEQPVLDWAAETTVHFEYNDKSWGDEKLVDLLFGAQPLGGTGVELPVHMRENTGYRVRVITDNKQVLQSLRDWLRNYGSGVPAGALGDLDVIAKFASRFKVEAIDAFAAAIQRVQEKLQPGRAMTGWVHLEGLIRRVIV
jgi:hypothetical protein